MTKTYSMSSIEHAIEVATRLTRSWFRGHARAVGVLTPRIWRREFRHETPFGGRPALELEMIDTFKREAPTLSEVPVPDEADDLGWLYMMQHYRTPTRLLDWTENLLVALHFVVSDQDDQDGELWALYPLALNKVAHVGWGMPLLNSNPVLQYLVREPYWAGTREKLAEECGIDVVPDRPAAFKPSRRFPRLVRQAGAFTIHPEPVEGGTIPELLPEPKHLVRYLIPGGAKRRIRSALFALGIDEYTLFPELEGLSKRIEHEARVIAYSPPAPPECGGSI